MSFPHGYALIVGVGSYANRPQNNVADTTVDANSLAEVLADPCPSGRYSSGKDIVPPTSTPTFQTPAPRGGIPL
jgi:hypothetical protein